MPSGDMAAGLLALEQLKRHFDLGGELAEAVVNSIIGATTYSDLRDRVAELEAENRHIKALAPRPEAELAAVRERAKRHKAWLW